MSRAAALQQPDSTYALDSVLDFYKSLPFNTRGSLRQAARSIRQKDPVPAYPALVPLLREGVSVLEVGCGTGWMSNSISYHYNCNVTGIDFNPVAIDQCEAVADTLELDTRFRVQDLFTYQPPKLFDVVVSLGVLHHTGHCIEAIKRICERCVRPNGHILLGLYHKPGREPFLEHFAEMQKAGASEDELFERYKAIHGEVSNDETHARSWFRDQVLHPHESQHTLEEIGPIVESCGFEIQATSLNQWAPIDSLMDIYRSEENCRGISYQSLQASTYYPGFFVFLAQKKSSASV